jgi:hypothetical protein
MITVKQPIATLPPWFVLSPILAAGFPPIITVAEPFIMVDGGPTHVHESPTTEAGIFPINTVGTPGPITGPPTWGTGGTPGVAIGHACISVILAAGGMLMSSLNQSLIDIDDCAFNGCIS